MTKVWGPMGWMTLHSISVCYPDEPTSVDIDFLNEFMNSFTVTITCITCRMHFTDLFNNYKQNIPSWNRSKKDLFLAICRLHNSVNKRLDKPIPRTVEECLSSIQNATSYTSQSEFRKKYIEYLFRDWNIYGRGTSYLQVALVNSEKMRKINQEYWNTKEPSYESILASKDDNVIDYVNANVEPTRIKFNMSNFGFKRRR